MNPEIINTYLRDTRTVLTLDAGGSKLEFSAVTGRQIKITPFVLPATPADLESYLNILTEGFNRTLHQLGAERKNVTAISFGFPGPAHYKQGIIGNLPNLPAFKGGVALKAFLEKKFNLPVFINNDGNLFTLGEWTDGFLPWVNDTFHRKGKKKRYKNLIGITLGTGFGCGIVIDGKLIIGDNNSGSEIWLFRNKLMPDYNVESSVGKGALSIYYTKKTALPPDKIPDARALANIAKGKETGNRKAAAEAYENLGIVAGDAIAHALSLVDGLVVIGGGLASAADLFYPSLLKELNSTIKHSNGNIIPRLVMDVYNLERKSIAEEFIHGKKRTIKIPGYNEQLTYDTSFRTGIGFTKLGTSRAVALGAYVFALMHIDSDEV